MNTTTDPKPTPILDPLLSLLRSRAFIVMIVTALINMLIIAVPDLGAYRDELMTVVTGLALAVIAKMGAEDVAKTLGNAKVDAAKRTADATLAAANAQATGIKQLPPTLPPPPH